jgi:hypothetical protein
VPAERYAARDRQSLSIHYIQGASPFVADVVAAPVRSHRRTVVHLDAGDGSDHFVGHRINDGDLVARAIGLDDTNGARRQGQSNENSQIHCLDVHHRLTFQNLAASAQPSEVNYTANDGPVKR